MNFFIWKFRCIILILLLFFAGVVKSSAFCTLLLLFQRVEVLKIAIWCKNVTQTFPPSWNSIDSVQKALDLTILAKNRRKMRIIDLNFQIKKLVSLASRLIWNWPFKLTTQPCFFVKLKRPNGYSVHFLVYFVYQITLPIVLPHLWKPAWCFQFIFVFKHKCNLF